MRQRGRTALLRWLHLAQIGCALLVLLTAKAEPQTLALLRAGGWRKTATLTPGLVKEALSRQPVLTARSDHGRRRSAPRRTRSSSDAMLS
jgi:hypothetical protein